MVGQSLGKGRYVYYRCRRSYAGSFEATCDSKYVPAASLEKTVLEQVIEVLSDPSRILAEARHLDAPDLDDTRAREIAEEVGKVEEKQRRLPDLYIGGSIPQDILDIKSQKLSQDRLRLRAESRLLVDLQPSGINLDLLEKTLPDAAARIKEWVLQASDEDMELILRGLDLQIRASGEGVQIEGCVPAQVEEEDNLVTIAQTSA